VDIWTKADLTDIKYIALGSIGSSFAVTNSGDVWVAGYNSRGTLGLGHASLVQKWTKTSLTDVKTVVSSKQASYAVTNTGDLWVTGFNGSVGQLGLGHENDVLDWTQTDLANVDMVYKNWDYYSVCALTNTGDVWVAGNNVYGQLGLGFSGTLISVKTWRKTSLSNIKNVILTFYGYAVTDTGELWVAGNNNFGQLGLGDTTERKNWEEALDFSAD
ncbi:MAG: hypothetical protein GY793_08155, partial [Proteobacteria bacterium]|nr:hypothetical protein [Pseudomonadota bacterium]